MATSLAVIILLGTIGNWLFSKMKLPGLLGMLVVGMVIGPNALNILDHDMMLVSAEFRKMALIVILLRAGLGISRDDLNAIGKTALKISIIPGLLEGAALVVAAQIIFGFSFITAGILAFIIAAVSPAVIVPHMLDFKAKGYGTAKRIPTLILAGASVDDIIAITLFSTFLGAYMGHKANIAGQLASVPISITLGIVLGLAVGFILVKVFENYHIRDTKKLMMIMGLAILLTALEDLLDHRVEIAGLLGVMAIGFVILEKRPVVAKRLSIRLNKIWVLAEILLFVLVGAQVNVMLALDAGLSGLLFIFCGLVARSIGVVISLIGSGLNRKEVVFAIIAYWPKATVQAAIGAIPLSMGVVRGDLILALAVLSIVVTAPLGAICLDLFHAKLLERADNV